MTVSQLTGLSCTAALAARGVIRCPERRIGRTPIARVLDCRDLDIGRGAANPQVRPRNQSTATGDLSPQAQSMVSHRGMSVPGVGADSPRTAIRRIRPDAR